MHSNRLNYDFDDYKAKLRRSSARLGLVCANTGSGLFSIFHPLPCCPWLEESRAKYYKKIRVRSRALKPGKKYTFATLTYSSRLYTPKEAAKRCKRDFNLLLKRLSYYHRRKKIEYFYIIELTDKMMVHFHIIFDQYIPHAKLKKSWFKVTGCAVVDIRKIPAGSAIRYITKYCADAKKMTEDKFRFIFENIDRLYAFSRGLCGIPEQLPKSWKYCFLIFMKEGVNEAEGLTAEDIAVYAAFPDHVGAKCLNPSDDWLFCPDLKHVEVIDCCQLYIPGIFDNSQLNTY